MKTWLCSLLLTLSLSMPGFSQIIFEDPGEQVPDREEPIHSLYMELLGNAYTFSMNYDYIGTRKFGFRLGISPYFLLDQQRDNEPPSSNEYSQSFQVLGMLNFFMGEGAHRLETGAGFVLGFSDRNQVDLPHYPAFTGTVGYRMVPATSDFTVKVAFTPIFSGGEFFPRIGFSLGYMF